MADIVGTAFVRIKALTDNLAKEIKSDFEKSLKKANLEKSARSHGEDVGEEWGDAVADSSGKTLAKRAKKDNPIANLLGDFDDVIKDVTKNFEKLDAPFSDFHATLTDIDRDGSVSLGRTRSQLKGLTDDIDRGPLNKALDDLAARFKKLGSSGSFNIGLLRGSLALVGGAIIAALPYIQDVGSAVLAYATGLVAQVGFLSTAIGGIGVAAAAAIGSTAIAAFPILLAFKAETEFLEHFKESLKETGQEFLAIGSATQQTLLPALDESLLIIENLIPMFSEFGLFVGKTVGQFSLFASETLIGVEAQGRFQAILQSSLRILDQLLPTLLNVGDLLSGLWVAAIPASERFVGTISRLVEHWRDLIVEGNATGQLTETLDLWYNRAELIGGALANVSGALFDILQVGADSSDNLFVRFDEWAERFRDFTESEAGQNRLKLIFDNSLAVMREINGVAAELFDGIFGRLGEVGGVDNMVAALQRFRDALPEIQERIQDLLGNIEKVTDLIAANAWDKFQQTIEELGEPLGRLGTQFLEFLDVMNDSGAFDIFLDLMRILTDTLATLLSIPGFGTFVGYMLAFGTAAKVASFALGPFIGLFGKFSALLIGLLRAGTAKGMVDMSSGLGKLAAGFKAASAASAGTGLLNGLSAGAGGARGFSGAIGGAAAAVSASGPLMVGLGLVGGALAIGGVAFYNHQRRAQEWEQEIRQATEAIGLLNDGLNITAEGVANYIRETSRFESRNQIDDIQRLGLSVASLGEQVAEGTLSFKEFIDTALATNEISFDIDAGRAEITGRTINTQIDSLRELQEEFDLTDDHIRDLAKGQTVFTDGVEISIDGNRDLLDSFVELNKVIGAAAKENIGAFATNAQNVRLLTAGTLGDIAKSIEDATDEEAARIMVDAQDDLAAAAVRSSEGIRGLSEATRDQIREQARLADGTVDVVKENELLYNASQRLGKQIRDELVLFSSVDFQHEFRAARDAVVQFSGAVDVAAQSGNKFVVGDTVDDLVAKFPGLTTATANLFTQLQSLPVDEFNASARALGIDADVLRGAMEGAQQAIIELQNQALESLPSIGTLLDEATSVKEDGSKYFDREGFVNSINERVTQTKNFGDNIKRIQEQLGDEAARLAIQQGPEAAANIESMIGVNGDQLTSTLQAMEEAEENLKTQISTVMGPGIALEYATQAGIIGNTFSSTLAGGLASDATAAAIQDAGVETLNDIYRVFRGRFEVVNGILRFVSTSQKISGNKKAQGGNLGFQLSEGGFVGGTSFGRAFTGGPKGTDTVPAWLTPGEFVLRQAVAASIPPNVLNSLNAGDPRLISLLTSLSRSRPGNPAALAVSSVGTTPAQSGGNLIIQRMNIEAPDPLESARQTTNRLRIFQSQLTRR